ncbi:MAG: ATP-binding protein, partial [Ilumatobacteraceae bacterium]
IHPSVLTNDGLAAALASLADRSPLPVELDVELPGRAAPQAEATAYFVASEALTNSARHSRATRATVRVVDNGSTLDVEVSDNGCGGAALGTGLGGLIDRVTSLGGSFVLDSPPGGGTRLSVQIPSAST